MIKSIPNKNKTYIGYTSDIKQRLRKHNLECKGGAKKTSKDAPWKLLMVVKGFLSGTTARQFEFAWQHPKQTRHIRENNQCKTFRHGATRSMKQSVTILKSLLSEKNALTKLCRLRLIFIDKEATDLWNKLDNIEPLPYVKLDGRYVLDEDEFLLHEHSRRSESYILKNMMIRLSHPPVCTICKDLVEVGEAGTVCENENSTNPDDRSTSSVAHLKCLRLKILKNTTAYSMLSTNPLEMHQCWKIPACGNEHRWSDIILHGGIMERVVVKSNDELDLLLEDDPSGDSNQDLNEEDDSLYQSSPCYDNPMVYARPEETPERSWGVGTADVQSIVERMTDDDEESNTIL